jgi:DNA-3-methyladenine glycosylase
MKPSEYGMPMRTKSPIENKNGVRLARDFYIRDVLDVAPELVGKMLSMKGITGEIVKYRITEVEAYRGEEDRACHAFRGRTGRTEVMYHVGGKVYVYFVYGMYWMLNIVTGLEDEPQAALIRGLEGINGPGRLTRELKIDRSFYAEDLVLSDRIWIEDNSNNPVIKTGRRIGISYAGEPWISKPWRFYI